MYNNKGNFNFNDIKLLIFDQVKAFKIDNLKETLNEFLEKYNFYRDYEFDKYFKNKSNSIVNFITNDEKIYIKYKNIFENYSPLCIASGNNNGNIIKDPNTNKSLKVIIGNSDQLTNDRNEKQYDSKGFKNK
ncbi:hypothetical protein BCR32DRAFT_291268 [Anaeromyces robustus]|uniref:Uncharacterized protein n=1 Tax=Anaeromyces robustus TaxID=1754192 RepID=A0A1Y1XFL9_9FUNG|nr:hypothetical protein BCR32DRAFT_291268 [Anaeromyces robustus]|eukprot:ORX84549.1 hypothetical protein BCR32DRAFT_291268 [Anaeromyces robustus]